MTGLSCLANIDRANESDSDAESLQSDGLSVVGSQGRARAYRVRAPVVAPPSFVHLFRNPVTYEFLRSGRLMRSRSWPNNTA